MRWSGAFYLLFLNLIGYLLVHEFYGAPWSALWALTVSVLHIVTHELCAAIREGDK